MMNISMNRGFQMLFSNGCQVSVQFGVGNYCDNNSCSPSALEAEYTGRAPAAKCANAEVAVFKANGEFLRIGACDAVVGYVSTDKVGQLIGYLANTPAPTAEDIRKLLGEE